MLSILVSSLRTGGVKFVVYPQDHIPRHVHAFCGEAEVIIELGAAGVSLALRHDAIRPVNAKRGDIKKALW